MPRLANDAIAFMIIGAVFILLSIPLLVFTLKVIIIDYSDPLRGLFIIIVLVIVDAVFICGMVDAVSKL